MKVACRADTPIGVLTAIYEDGRIRRVLFPDEAYAAADVDTDDTLPFAQQIGEYFEGKRRMFELPIYLSGTRFKHEVYAAVLSIPYGKTATYGEVALMAGHPRAMRAVGTVMRDTPVPILIPCHRVVHQSKKKGAYRGGMDSKNILLDMERRFAEKDIANA
ncbi:MAG: methylated-DNA--[protein]-cysteine S-methyltransferase [Bacillota bacterium]